LAVDAIGDIVTFNLDALVLPPAHLSGQFQDTIHGAFRLSEGLLIALDSMAIVRNAQNLSVLGSLSHKPLTSAV
jgi:chemotaxis signal transduction protein